LLLARLNRSLALAGIKVDWEIPSLESGCCRMRNPDLLTDSKLALEAYELDGQLDADNSLGAIADWLAQYALPDTTGYDYFREKLKTDLVLLSDDELHYFVVNSTVVEPHVKIDDVSGTADGGALFYTENLPPESLLFTVLMASQERYKRGDSADNRLDASQIMNALVNGNENCQALQSRMVQFGGDATTGRGQIVCTIVGGQ